jgi:hypothetical protein
MDRKRKAPGKRKVNPHFWVFCEGKTEEAYVTFLRAKYRVPVEIVPKIVGNKITARYIKEYKRGKPIHEKDKDFLMYDADVPEILEKLKKIEPAILITSNPCIELWFLLHYKNEKATVSADKCIRELSNRNRNQYKKGLIDSKLEMKLDQNYQLAAGRAKQLILFENPSSNIFVLIEEMMNAKNTSES